MQQRQTSKKKKSYFGLARCPYCKSKVPYFKSFFDRDDGEYTCDSCGETSNIYFMKKMNIVVAIVSLFSVLVFVLYLFFGDKASALGMILVFTPFFLFFASTPLFFRLAPIEESAKEKDRNISSNSRNISSHSDKKPQVQSKRHIIIGDERPVRTARESYGSYEEKNTSYAGYEERSSRRRAEAENYNKTSVRRGTLSEQESATRIHRPVSGYGNSAIKTEKMTEYERVSRRNDALAEYERATEKMEADANYERAARRRETSSEYERKQQKRDVNSYGNYERKSSSAYSSQTRTRPSFDESEDVKIYSPEKRKVKPEESRVKGKSYTFEQRRAMSQRQVRSQAAQRQSQSENYNRLNMDEFDDFD